jgi:hypothetical protein
MEEQYEPCICGSRNYAITVTQISCKQCSRLWGRVNGFWVFDIDSEPKAEQDEE